MRKYFRLTAALLAISVIAVQCTKNPVSETMNDDMMQDFDQAASVQQVEDLNAEIDTLEEESVSDSTVNPYKHLAIALLKLDYLLNKTERIVKKADVDSAVIFYHQARDAQKNALDAAKIDSLDLAFGYVKESREFAIDAIKMVLKELGPPPILEHIQKMREDARALVDELKPLLEDSHNIIAHKCFAKGTLHMHLAKQAMENRELRRAALHLRTAIFWLNRVKEIVE